MNPPIRSLTAIRIVLTAILAVTLYLYLADDQSLLIPLISSLIIIILAYFQDHAGKDEESKLDEILDFALSTIPVLIMLAFDKVIIAYLALMVLQAFINITLEKRSFNYNEIYQLGRLIYVALPAMMLILDGPIWDEFGLLIQLIGCGLSIISLFLRIRAERGMAKRFDM